MSALVEFLKRDHAALIAVLDRVRTMGGASPEAKALLFSAKNALLAHLAKENEELYPALRRAAQKDAKLQQTLDLFARDLEPVADAARRFFDRYERIEKATGSKFGEELGELLEVLGDRMRREEALLYVTYDAL